jgi:hypothetical protein
VQGRADVSALSFDGGEEKTRLRIHQSEKTAQFVFLHIEFFNVDI